MNRYNDNYTKDTVKSTDALLKIISDFFNKETHIKTIIESSYGFQFGIENLVMYLTN